jgi:hypothetical protein
MIGTMTPLVQEMVTSTSGRSKIRPASTLAAHWFGYLLGALTLAVLSRLPLLALQAADKPAARLILSKGPLVIALVSAYVLVSLASRRRIPLPMRDRQVPISWRETWGSRRALPLYGFVLGTGVVTKINSPAFYLVPIASLLSPSWTWALLPALAFGFGRGTIALARSLQTYKRFPIDHENQTAAAFRTRMRLAGGQLVVLIAVAFVGFRTILS